MASRDCKEESGSFGRDKSRAQSGMLRVPVASGQEPWTQGSEEVEYVAEEGAWRGRQ